MTILSVIAKVCPKIGLDVPSALFASAEREHVELAALANDTADMISLVEEWQALSEIATFTGDGTEEDFDLPDDWGWMGNAAQVWSSGFPLSPLDQVKDRNEWIRAEIQNDSFVTPRYIIYGDQFHIRLPLDLDVTAKTPYQSKFWGRDAGGDPIGEFTADDDVFRLNERLLALAITYRWKEDKELAYAQHQEEYAELLEKLIGRDIGPRRIAIGRPGAMAGIKRAYPSALGGS